MTAVEPGQNIFSSSGPPDPGLGLIGDYYIDKTGGLIYGAKTQEGGWGTGYPIAGDLSSIGDLDGAADGDVLTYDVTTDTWLPQAIRYTHVQATASATWSVTHNLGTRPGGVMVVDSGDTMVLGDVAHVSDNALTITFSAPFGGKAYIS